MASTAQPAPASEVYVLLGRIGACLFFGGARRQSGYPLARVASDLYNLLICEAALRAGDNLVVFGIRAGPGGLQVATAQAWHITFRRQYFPPGALGPTFRRLYAAERPPAEPSLAVRAEFAAGRAAQYVPKWGPLGAEMRAAMRFFARAVPPGAVRERPACALSLLPIPHLENPPPDAEPGPSAPPGAGEAARSESGGALGPIEERQGLAKMNGDAKRAVLRVERLSVWAVLPKRATPGAAGYDLTSSTDLVVPAGGLAQVPTGWAISVPPGTYGRLASRSGLAMKHLAVGAGVVDADYRGHVQVVLYNHGSADYTIRTGDRIAQLILETIETPEVEEVSSLDSTERSTAGFGSTGV